ncbi:efflux transporter outer membrane subunit [Celerinatantimonas sp. YJH-8]|uniref:efflux transporter outer membrane subunit n=1 Tax=Celerinatantimonas sp. YJH-8 TaxID=3228714 RepID=UPI0038C813D9
MAKNQFKTIAWLMSFILISGCASFQGINSKATIQKPDAVSPEQLKEASKPLDSKWWQVFQDNQLNWLLDQGTAHSPTLKQADARVRRALASAGEVKSGDRPHIDANADMGYHKWPEDSHYGGGLAGEHTWDNTANLQFSYHLDLFDRQANRNRQAHANIALSQASAQAARLQLEGNLLRSYIQLTLYYQELDVERARLEQQNHIVRLNQQRLDYGLGSQYDLQQSMALLPITQRRISVLHEQIKLTKNQLMTLAGLPLSQTAQLQRPSLVLTDELHLPQALPIALIGHRPDLVASRWQIVSSARGIDLAKADFYPNINLHAMLGQMMTLGGLSNFFEAKNRTYSVGPALSLPIFDGGARRARLGIATADYDEAIEGYNATLQTALRQVSDEMIRQQSIRQQSQLADLGVDRANQVYTTAQEAFKRGLRDYLHVLDAQSRLFDQEIARATVQSELMRSQVDLAIAMGGGITFESTPASLQLLPTQAAQAKQAAEKTAATTVTKQN